MLETLQRLTIAFAVMLSVAGAVQDWSKDVPSVSADYYQQTPVCARNFWHATGPWYDRTINSPSTNAYTPVQKNACILWCNTASIVARRAQMSGVVCT